MTTPEQRVGRRAEQKRRWDEVNRGTCEMCGTRVARKSRRCRLHSAARMAARARQDTIIVLWQRGWTAAAIAAEIGTTEKTISVTIVRLRRQGHDLPYRHRGRNAVA